MSHADVAAIIENAIGTPGRLRALLAAETEEGAAIRAHLADCDECRAEADAWQAVDEALVAVTPDTMKAPTAARSRILGNVLATGVARGPDLVLGTAARPAAAAAPAPAAPALAAEPPAAGRVWRTPGGAPMPSPMPAPVPLGAAPESPIGQPVVAAGSSGPAAAPPTAPSAEPATPPDRRGLRILPGGKDGDGVGFRVFLAVAAAAVFLFALGAALGGPLGLTSPSTVQDTTARTELEKVTGRLSDLLQEDGATVAPLTDQAGEPAGAVILHSRATDSRLLGVVTRSLPPLPDGGKYVCILVRGEERYEVGYMKFASDTATDGDVAYWIAPLSDEVPLDAGAPGDTFNVYVDGDTGGDPLLTTTF